VNLIVTSELAPISTGVINVTSLFGTSIDGGEIKATVFICIFRASITPGISVPVGNFM